jgi:hypothetical protein
VDELRNRENWYLSTFNPLLNVATSASDRPSTDGSVSMLIRSKICVSLVGRVDTEDTRANKRASRLGSLNPFFGIGPGIKALD